MSRMLTGVGLSRYRLANTEFLSTMQAEGSTPSLFHVHLEPAQIADFGDLRSKLHFARVLQATRDESGAAALTILVGAPSKLVVVSSSPEEPTALLGFAERRGCEQSLLTVAGVEPTDRDRWQDIVEAQFPDRSLDVSIDDGAYWRDSAGQLFESVFPNLADGGRYLMLGWVSIHRMFERFSEKADWSDEDAADARDRMLDERGESVEALLPLLLAANRSRPDVVRHVEVTRHWIEIGRGPADVDPESFRLAALAGE
jgi:hypothetical protein